MSRIKTDLDEVLVKLVGALHHRGDCFEITLGCREPVRNLLDELESKLSEKVVALTRRGKAIDLRGKITVRACGIGDQDEIHYFVQARPALHRYFPPVKKSKNAVELPQPAASNQQATQ